MTVYTDIPTANSLYAESERTLAAANYIDQGALLINFTIGAPPPSGSPVGTPSMPIMITPDASNPPSAALMADIRAYLVTRQTALNSQLTALGVTNTPAPIGPPPTREEAAAA